MPLLLTLIPALLPALTDGIRGLIGKVTGGAGARPQNIAEVIQLMQADTDRLKTLAALDVPAGNVSQWVANVRAMQRPLACALVIGGYILAIHTKVALPAGVLDTLGSYAQMVTFYLFGDRSYAYLKGK